MSKRKFLTLEERVKVIKWSENGKSGRTIAEQLGVGKTQVQSILKRKREIMDEFDNNSNTDIKRPRRASTFEDVNELVLKWFNEATSRQVNVSGPLLKERALQYAKDLHMDSFKASNGWLDSFLKRNNIVFKQMSGERGSVNQKVVGDWKDKLPTVCEGFEAHNIFNMDETGLFYRDSTKSTYFKKGEDCAGGKRSKERITVALCASMTGEKVTPLVIGKFNKPRCFSGIGVEKLPVMYRANKSAWMTTNLYEEWLRYFDRKMVGRKVLLFVDNAPTHCSVNLKNVTVKYLPPNTTSFCQPMDQGIIQTLKLKYRQKQLQHVVNQMDVKPGKTGIEMLKEISILDAIFWISRSWSQVQESTITKCFRKCGFIESAETSVGNVGSEESDDDDDDDDNFPLDLHVQARQLFDCDLRELIAIDNQFVTSDQESRDWCKPAQDLLTEIRNDEIEEVDNEEIPEETVCTTNECFSHIIEIKKFAIKHGFSNVLDSALELIEQISAVKNDRNSKQTKISDFFKAG